MSAPDVVKRLGGAGGGGRRRRWGGVGGGERGSGGGGGGDARARAGVRYSRCKKLHKSLIVGSRTLAHLLFIVHNYLPCVEMRSHYF